MGTPAEDSDFFSRDRVAVRQAWVAARQTSSQRTAAPGLTAPNACRAATPQPPSFQRKLEPILISITRASASRAKARWVPAYAGMTTWRPYGLLLPQRLDRVQLRGLARR